MWLQLTVVVALLALVAQARSDISKGKLPVINSEVKPGNLLPQFLFMMGSVEVSIIMFYLPFIHSLIRSLTHCFTH